MTVLSTASVYSDLVQTTFIKFTYALCSHLCYVGALVYHTSTMDRYNPEVILRRGLEATHAERLTSWSGLVLLVWSVGFLLLDAESTLTMRSKRANINTIWVWSMRLMYASFWLSALTGFFSNALSSSLFAVSCLAAMTRLIFFAGSHKTLGPLLIVIQEMCVRLVGFAIIFVVVILSYWTFETWTTFAAGRTVDTINTDETQRILVALFGEINPSSRPLSIYLILGVMGVLLISMMTDAYSSVKQKAHFEWQYLRAPTVMTVEMMPSAPVPLNSVHFVLKQLVNAAKSRRWAGIVTPGGGGNRVHDSHHNGPGGGGGGGGGKGLAGIVGDGDATIGDASPRSEGAGTPRATPAFRGSFTRETLDDEDEATKDQASSRRDMEAVGLMRTLADRRIESRRERLMTKRMLGEAVGIQDDIMKALESIKYTQDTLTESLQRLEDTDAVRGAYPGGLRKRDSLVAGGSPLAGAGAGAGAGGGGGGGGGG